MDLMDSDFFSFLQVCQSPRSIVADGEIKLGYLIVLWIIGIKVILPVKLAVLVDLTVYRKAYCKGIFHYLLIKDWKGTGHTRAYRQVWVLGAPPNSVEQAQKIFVFVASSTWTSSPITVSYCLLIYLSSLPAGLIIASAAIGGIS